MARSPKDLGVRKHARKHGLAQDKRSSKGMRRMMRAVRLMKTMAMKAMKSMAMNGKGKLRDGMGKRRGSRANARGRVSLTSGVKVEPAHMKRHGRPTLPEARGPAYTDPAFGKRRGANNHIARLPISERIAVVELARMKPVALANALVELGILPNQGGRCSECKAGTVKLVERPGRGSEITVGTTTTVIEPPGQRIWRCGHWDCQKRYINMDPAGPLKDLFGKGTVSTWTTLMAIAHCASKHAAG